MHDTLDTHSALLIQRKWLRGVLHAINTEDTRGLWRPVLLEAEWTWCIYMAFSSMYFVHGELGLAAREWY